MPQRLLSLTVKFKAVIKNEGNWWIGWLVDLPGVNAQERTYEELVESLKIGAEDMLALEPEIPEDARLETIEI